MRRYWTFAMAIGGGSALLGLALSATGLMEPLLKAAGDWYRANGFLVSEPAARFRWAEFAAVALVPVGLAFGMIEATKTWEKAVVATAALVLSAALSPLLALHGVLFDVVPLLIACALAILGRPDSPAPSSVPASGSSSGLSEPASPPGSFSISSTPRILPCLKGIRERSRRSSAGFCRPVKRRRSERKTPSGAAAGSCAPSLHFFCRAVPISKKRSGEDPGRFRDARRWRRPRRQSLPRRLRSAWTIARTRPGIRIALVPTAGLGSGGELGNHVRRPVWRTGRFLLAGVGGGRISPIGWPWPTRASPPTCCSVRETYRLIRDRLKCDRWSWSTIPCPSSCSRSISSSPCGGLCGRGAATAGLVLAGGDPPAAAEWRGSA